MPEAALAGLKVLDLSQYVAGPYCTRLLAGFGAEVIKVEKPGVGDMTRSLAPCGQTPEETNPLFLYLNTSKKSIALDLKAAADKTRLIALIEMSDVLVESFAPGVMDRLGLDYATLEKVNPWLVMTSVSNFGQWGPYRDYKASHIVESALAGWSHCGGEESREPLQGAALAGFFCAGMAAVNGTLTALHYREKTGIGQHVDVSIMEAMLPMTTHITIDYELLGRVRRRVGNYLTAGYGLIVKCRDGYLGVNTLTNDDWEMLCQLIEMPELLEDPRFKGPYGRLEHQREISARITPWFVDKVRNEVFRTANEWRIPFGLVLGPEDVLNADQFRERGLFMQVPDAKYGMVSVPAAPFKMPDCPWQLYSGAPKLGEHNAEIEARLAQLRASPVAGQESVQVSPKRAADGDAGRSLPLAGVRVVDLSMFWAGPFAANVLADMGAEVIKIESIQHFDTNRTYMQVRPDHPEAYERSVTFHGSNRNKCDLTLDLNRPQGVALLKELVKKSDIVLENFSPRVMQNFGLGYDVLSQVNPKLIMVSMSAYGSTGPWRDYPSFAVTVDQVSGRTYLSGYHDGGPMLLGVGIMPGDAIGGLTGALAVQLALAHRARTGRGQHIDLSFTESSVALLGHEIAAVQMGGRDRERWGNRHPSAAPQGCYRCKGDDKWAAITVANEDEWRVFKAAMGSPAWADRPEFSDIASRWRNHDELDSLIETWTVTREPAEAMRELQAAGVACGAVLTAPEVLANPQFGERAFFEEVQLPGIGPLRLPGMLYKLSKTPGRIRRPAPRLGEDNEDVLGNILGLSSEAIAALREAQIIGTRPAVQAGGAMV